MMLSPFSHAPSWTEDWTCATFIPLSKEDCLEQCGDHTTIALVSCASKVLLRIIFDRIHPKMESKLASGQGVSDKEEEHEIL